MNYITHIIEPERLLLSWQLPKDCDDRQRMIVAELRRTTDSADLYYLADSEEYKQATEKGFKGYPGYPIENTSYYNVLSAFMMRIPPRSRKDFPTFLTSIRLPDNAEVSDFALLGYSNAILPGDDFTIIHAYENAEPPFEILTQIQGYRHITDTILINDLRIGMNVSLNREPDNPRDTYAISVLVDGKKIGYIRRGLLKSLHKWLDDGLCIRANIEKINGTESYPRIYVFLSIED